MYEYARDESRRHRMLVALGLAIVAEVERRCRAMDDEEDPPEPRVIADTIISHQEAAFAEMMDTIRAELATASPLHYQDEEGPLTWQRAVTMAYRAVCKGVVR